jgi:RNA polymerase sigma factor (sigma-70 family)
VKTDDQRPTTDSFTTSVESAVASDDGAEWLAPYLQAESEEESERLLAQLITQYISPIIRECVGYKLRSTFSPSALRQDAQQREDLFQDALVRLLPQLRRYRANRHAEAIKDLRGFVATIAYRTYYDYLRRKYPHRRLLKNKLCYLLTHQSGLALWDVDADEMTAGYAAWRGQSVTRSGRDNLARLMGDAHALLPAATLTKECEMRRPSDLLAAIFDLLGGPIALDDLVNLVAALWEVKEPTVEDGEEALAVLPDPGPDARVGAQQGEFLRGLWAEVLQLPVRQRCALLLNLRDATGQGCIALLPLTGVASLVEIAGALEMSAHDLAELWGRLPLDDQELAERLALTRQQIINLRKAGRARLARRLKDFL